MKSSIPQYTFYKKKYGSELLVDIVGLKYIKCFLAQQAVHTLTYYDITFVTEGEGQFSINNKCYDALPFDVFFSKPGEIRNWDTNKLKDGYALIFEDAFLSSLFKDSLFVQHLSFFKLGKQTSKLHLSKELYSRIYEILKSIKVEIANYKLNGVDVLKALLYEVLMLLDRAYQTEISNKGDNMKDIGKVHMDKYINLVNNFSKEHHTVQYYADKLCITSNYLNEIVTSSMGVSAKQYIISKVIDEARRLLVYTDYSISDIAFELHFSTVSYFIRSFRLHTGETPLSYRKKHKP